MSTLQKWPPQKIKYIEIYGTPILQHYYYVHVLSRCERIKCFKHSHSLENGSEQRQAKGMTVTQDTYS